MRVTAKPPISFTCTSCRAENEGEESEFTPQNTMPPTWRARCGFCHTINVCSPTPLIAKMVGVLTY